MIRRVGVFLLVLGVAACASASEEGSPLTDEPNFAPGRNVPAPPASAPAPSFTPTFPTDPLKVGPPPPPAAACLDKTDAGGSETLATTLPATDDCDNADKTVTGVMNGPVDVDFYKFAVKDRFGCSFGPHFEAKTAGTQMCVFVSCSSGPATIASCADGAATTSETGLKGCCATGPANVTPNWDCPGFTDNDSAEVFVRVKQTAGKACLPYAWSYRF